MKKNENEIYIKDVLIVVFGILTIIGFFVGVCFTIALFFEYTDYKLSWCLTGWFSYIIFGALVPDDDINK